MLVAGGAAGGGWYYTHQGDSHRAGKVEAAKVPIYITLEPFYRQSATGKRRSIPANCDDLAGP
ncbi:hypothetical protein ACFS07_22460 [Undibacterium arcticum]